MIRVVLADDQALIRQGIRRLLEMTGEVEVVADVADGEGALSAIAMNHPDVALLDVRMPSPGGVEAVRALRARGDTTPVILLTTFDDDQALLDGVRAGIAGFLLKDVSLEKLLGALRHVAGGGRLILPEIDERARRHLETRPLPFDGAERPDALTARELEVLRLMAGGYSNREIATAHGVAEATVKNQASSIFSKLGVRDRTRAVLLALQRGLLR